MVNPQRSWRCNSVTMSRDLTTRGTIASSGEQWKEVLVLLVKHAPGERCYGQSWDDSRGFRIVVSDLRSQHQYWGKLQFWRKEHCASKAAKQHHRPQRTLSWRDISTHVADFTVIIWRNQQSSRLSNCQPNHQQRSPHHHQQKDLARLNESLGASCHFFSNEIFFFFGF